MRNVFLEPPSNHRPLNIVVLGLIWLVQTTNSESRVIKSVGSLEIHKIVLFRKEGLLNHFAFKGVICKLFLAREIYFLSFLTLSCFKKFPYWLKIRDNS